MEKIDFRISGSVRNIRERIADMLETNSLQTVDDFLDALWQVSDQHEGAAYERLIGSSDEPHPHGPQHEGFFKESPKNFLNRIEEMGNGPEYQYGNRNDQGLDGPIIGSNGRKYYYDTKAGQYYDPLTDIYLSNDEVSEIITRR